MHPLRHRIKAISETQLLELKMHDFNSPISPATSESNPENTTEHSEKCSGVHSNTTISLARDGIGVVCFHCTACAYFFPADRCDAPSAWILNHGCWERRATNRCPTVPVAPSTPTLISRECSGLCMSRSMVPYGGPMTMEAGRSCEGAVVENGEVASGEAALILDQND